MATMCSGSVPAGYTYINDKYYYYNLDGMSYMNAYKTCKNDGARLAPMKTLQEFNNVWAPLSSKREPSTLNSAADYLENVK